MNAPQDAGAQAPATTTTGNPDRDTARPSASPLPPAPDPENPATASNPWVSVKIIRRADGSPIGVFRHKVTGAWVIVEREGDEPITVKPDDKGNYIDMDSGRAWRPDGTVFDPHSPVVSLASRRPAQAAATAKPDEWAEPADLSSPIDSLPYPISAFPEPARGAVVAYRNYGGQPMALVASACLAQMSLAAQPLADVARDPRLSGPIGVYVTVVGDSGDRKTKADNEFSAPAREWEENEVNRLRPDWLRSQDEIAIRKSAVEGIRKRISNLSGKPSVADKTEMERLSAELIELGQNPVLASPLPKLFYSDTTPGGLSMKLTNGWPSAGIISAEGAVALEGHGSGKDTIMEMLALWNTLWDGNNYSQDRKVADEADIRGRRFSIFIMMQPEIMRRLIEKGARHIGFIARFLLSAPLSTKGYRPYNEPPADWAEMDDFKAAIMRLLNAELPIDCSQSDKGRLMRLKPPVMTLGRNAKRAFVEYHDSVEKEMRPFGDFAAISDIASKSAENAVRIAGIFKLFDQGRPGNEVEARYVDAGIQVAAWHLGEAQRVFHEVAAPEKDIDARELSAWLCGPARELQDRDGGPIIVINDKGDMEIPARQVGRYGPNRTRDTLRRDAALDVLEEAGHVRRVDRGRQKLVTVNPRLLVNK